MLYHMEVYSAVDIPYFFTRKRTPNIKLGVISHLEVVLIRITTTTILSMVVGIQKEKIFLMTFLAFFIYFL